MKKIIIILLLFPTVIYASESKIPSWSIARNVMQDCYGGWDIEVKVSGGYETRYYQDGPVSGPTANAMFTVPLYSRKERLSRQESTNKQIEHLAELYAEAESQIAIISALTSEKDVLKKVMIDSGQQGIKAYYELLQEIENCSFISKTLIDSQNKIKTESKKASVIFMEFSKILDAL